MNLQFLDEHDYFTHEEDDYFHIHFHFEVPFDNKTLKASILVPKTKEDELFWSCRFETEDERIFFNHFESTPRWFQELFNLTISTLNKTFSH